MKRIFSMCILTTIFTVLCSAQITIGSEVIPEKGAILDLKQEDKPDGSVNSTKGLGLPRVILKTLTLSEGKTSLASTIDEATGDWDPEDHIGLVIYNVQPKGEVELCPVDPIFDELIAEGPYVWDGNEWQYLGMTQSTSVGPDVVEYVEDNRDGDRYPYSAFGDPSDPDNFAGYWMLENARFIDHTMLNFTKEGGHGGAEPDIKDRYYLYPNDYWGNSTGAKPETWRPNQGLLYTYSAATLGGQDAIWQKEGIGSQGQEAGPIETTPIIQGVCPEGWHVPTDREWNMLAKVIFNNPEKYSSYAPSFGLDPNSVQWDSDLEVGEPNDPTFQGVADGENKIGLGIAMLSPCSPLVINNGQIDRDTSVGKSKSSLAGGFNVLLVGGITFGSISDPKDSYTQAAMFVTSSISDPENGTVWGRAIDKTEAYGVLRVDGPASSFGSVRCKRD